MKILNKLLNSQIIPTIAIERIITDSRQVNKGDLFIALIGHQVDARDFIPQAIAKGASAILAQTEDQSVDLSIRYEKNCVIVDVYALDKKLSSIAGKFFNEPSHHLDLIGVTGTNGKTTISQVLAEWLTLLGNTTAAMGTIGNGLYDQLQTALNTTGSPVEIQQNLAEFVQQGAKYCVMEVSSHGLVQHRVEALHFVASIFTNLSHDHLDYHKTMQSYASSKKRLFTELDVGANIINIDDEIGMQWLSEISLKRQHKMVAVSSNPDGHARILANTLNIYFVQAKIITYSNDGALIHFESSWGEGIIRSALIGPFNVSNILLALSTMLVLDFKLESLLESAVKLTGVCGRMEPFTAVNKPTTIIDYAHTPDALLKAIEAARLHCEGKLWCVFGCGGDRDQGKRPLMGELAEKYADIVILTDDNPRTEEPAFIIQQILDGFIEPHNATVIHGREIALQYCLTHAATDDVILIAGKGHEDYQIIGTTKMHFSDREIVIDLLAE